MKQVIVCGAGIVGLCCALYLRERGYEVTIVERDSDLRDGCSFGNAGLVVPSHFEPLAAPGMIWLGIKYMFNRRSPFYIHPRPDPDLIGWVLRFMQSANASKAERSARVLLQLLLASRELHDKLPGDTGGSHVIQRGLMVLCRTQQALDHEAKVAQAGNAMGLPAEVISARRAAELDPDIRMNVAGGVYFPGDSHLDPHAVMAKLRQLAVSVGTKLVLSTDIIGWQFNNGRISAVRTNQGDLQADEFVLAAGSWSSKIVRDLGLKLPLQAGKGYSLTIPQSRQLPRMPSLLKEARVAVTPIGNSLRFAGTMELGAPDRSISRERVSAIVEGATQYFPDLRVDDFNGVQPWAGFRSCSPDGVPYIGRFARFSNLCVATGHAMLGVSLGPITGQMVAQIVSGEQPRLPMDALSPDRFN